VGAPALTGEQLYFDIETNGLLDLGPKLVTHCIAITDLDTGEEFYYGPPVPASHMLASPQLVRPAGSVLDAVRRLAAAGLTVAHNGIGFDYLALEQCYPEDYSRPARAWDSMVAAKMVWPVDALMDADWARVKRGTMPVKWAKRHALKAWGYRLGEGKDDYLGDLDKYPELRDVNPASPESVLKQYEGYVRRWDEWNVYMASYMMQDNRPGVKLWNLTKERVGWTDAKADVVWPEEVFETEMEVARIIQEQEDFGVRFDFEAARKLSSELRNEKARLEQALIDAFGSWWEHTQDAIVGRTARRAMKGFQDVSTPRVSEKTGKELKPDVGPPVEVATEGSRYTHVEYIDFKPSSRDHLGRRLQLVFGWNPKKIGANGKPTVDESVLEEIPEAVMPEAVRRDVLDYFVVTKTLGMLDLGTNAWTKIAERRGDGRIHGRIDTLGAVTGRPTHSSPNMSQVPGVKKEKTLKERLKDGTAVFVEQPIPGLRGKYGMECRALITADEGWELTGVDASSGEYIMLGHYLWPLDGGKFSAKACNPDGDLHQENAAEAGMTRGEAKTTGYLYVYGGSAYKLSLALGITPEEIPENLAYRGLPMLLKSLEKRFDADFVAKLDDAQKAKIAKARQIILKFEAGIDGIKVLKDAVAAAAEKGWLKGLDGRKMIVRKAFSSLNTILQSALIQVIKRWMVLMHRELRARGYVHGLDYKQVLWSHDELQFTHKPGMGPLIRELADQTIKEAGRALRLRGECRSDGKTGYNWCDTH
jgi:DNA polymerase-1